MVIRLRFRRIVIPLVLYAIMSGVTAYFAYHAYHGQRGLEAKKAIKQHIFELKGELAVVQSERATWERRVALMRTDNLDRDLLDERARVLLNEAGKNDVVVILDRKP